jgi:DNA-binding transcriptional ArsR family regulator
MPIRRTDLGEGSRDPSALIVDFLSVNFRFAYTMDELLGELASRGINLSKEDMGRLLISLEYGGGIESEVKDGVTYYQYRKVFGFTPLKKA